VVKVARPLLLISGEGGGGFTSILFRADSTDHFPAQTFSLLTGKLSPVLPFVQETGLFAPRMRFFALLPLWLLFVLAVRRYLTPRLPGGMLTRAAVMILSIVLGAWLLRVPSPITPNMLPSYWSDFSYWPERFQALVDHASASWLLHGTMSGLLLGIEVVIPVIAGSLGGVVTFVAACGIVGRESR
jgi:hypothetical protein